MKTDFHKTNKKLMALASIGISINFMACAKIETLNSSAIPGQSSSESSQGDENSESDQTAQEPANYIVVLKQNPILVKATLEQSRSMVVSSLNFLEKRMNLEAPRMRFSSALHGGLYKMTREQAQLLKKDPNVAYIEKDQIIHVNAAQSNAPWGLDRIDQQNLPLSGNYSSGVDGVGVNAYVIDTGILTTHQEFEGRAKSGRDLVDNDNDATDCNGHGTHVAGTIGSRAYGVAKKVNLIGVRVLDCNGSGSYSGVIAGVDWVTANHKKPAVANMSLGGPLSQALEDAILNSIKAGVTYAVAAGNDNQSACNSSPARMPDAIKVGATSNTDQRASFSNFGSCVDLFAPGVDIESTWDTSSTSTNKISGTSMATPHVAGVIALYLERNPASSPAQVKSALLAGSTSGKVTSPGTGSPNKLLNIAFVAGSNPPPPPPPEDLVLRNGVVTAAFSGAKGSEKTYTLVVPSGAKNMVVEMSGGSPDADLYLKFGSKSSVSTYDCRPYTSSNNEKCSVTAPKVGTYYITVRGYSAFSGVVLKASFQ